MLRVLATSVILLGCSPMASIDAGSDAPRLDAAADAGSVSGFEVIGERTATVLDVARRIELVRGTRPDGATTYFLYVHAQTEPAPVVIVNEPYAGIDWTGEAVDARWAALGDGLHPDVDAPDYDGDDVTTYGAQTVQAAAESDAVWLLNGAAVVHVYARFYAGGTLRNDAEDAAMAYAFVATRSELLPDRIGSYGGSWGGMMALFGAALATDAHPLTVVALAPPTDFIDLYQHTHVELPARYPTPATVEAFFSPYWRRAAPAIGFPPALGDPRVAPFTTEDLCALLPPDVVIPHDDVDLLIPVRQTEALAAACADRVHPIFWRRGALDYATLPLDHGYFGTEPDVPSVRTFSDLHVVSRLFSAAPVWAALGHQEALEVFLTLTRAASDAGEDVSFALAPLREVADPKTQLFDPTLNAFVPGADMLAAASNAALGTSYDAASLRARLVTELP